MGVAIKVENLSKAYQLGEIGTGTLSNDLKRWAYKVRGKEDPFLKIGETNDRTTKGESNMVWSLKDINFEIEQGDAVGIIGRNGAGKSTLLKILSRVTSPTTGSVKVKGRVASLLEVGTGFHPELTGRENIFLNGAILGMRKAEIKKHFDAIVDFAGVERYIDTPVKRYSSGMYVRLAFAVAAHLESEILVVDEVLAVGDAEFQKKCLGKMNDVSKGEGRTILFVSHNLTAVETLCNNGILLNSGFLETSGAVEKVVKNYINLSSTSTRSIEFNSITNPIGNSKIRILTASVELAEGEPESTIIDINSKINLKFTVLNFTNDSVISVGYDLKTLKGDTIFGSGKKFIIPSNQETELTCHLPGNFLNDDVYSVNIYFHTQTMSGLYAKNELLIFEVKDIERETGYLGKVNGFIRTNFAWSVKELSRP
ncbi:ABC transporter ATP-binding protein [Pedobacter arcticus]|uniref:ABC transporter ATP-binding protein n=1 Tax=Pedobacter arcticus TaxID=752140 RepID=UPI0002DF9C20|nr:ABC transporter ATP-binding protein [Pedobacter arcticus]